jgi:glucan phosphoethanolaminetransferase (alkaline phosphatase superfamily)
MLAVEWFKQNRLLIYCFVVYLTVAFVSNLWSLPSKVQIVANAISPNQSSSTMIISPLQALVYVLPIIIFGFVIGYFALKSHKYPKIKILFLSVSGVVVISGYFIFSSDAAIERSKASAKRVIPESVNKYRLFERAVGGVLVLDNLHALSEENQNKLKSI